MEANAGVSHVGTGVILRTTNGGSTWRSQPGGVTTVLNMGSPLAILQFREQVKYGKLLGPAIFASAFVDSEGSRGWIVRTPEEAQTDARDIKSRNWDFIKVSESLKSANARI